MRLTRLLLIAALSGLAGPVYALFPDDWNRKVEVAIQSSQVASTLTDFPVLLTKDTLPSEICDADGSNPAQDGGGDIRITSDSAGSTLLPVDVVTFSTANDPANCVVEVWAKVASVSSSANTSIYVWYNTSGTESQPAVTNAAGRNAVWTDYEAVYHGDDTTDSTGSGHTLTAVGGALTGQTGTIGDALNFDGTDDYFSTTSFQPATGSQNFSVTAWVRFSGAGQDAAIAWWGTDASTSGGKVEVRLDEAGVGWAIRVENNGGFTTATTNMETASWQHAAVVLDGTTTADVTHYVDGAAETVIASGTNTFNVLTDDSLQIGARVFSSTVGNFWRGDIDEIRFRQAALSADWVDAEHSNHSAPATFAVAGTPEATGGGTAIPTILRRRRD